MSFDTLSKYKEIFNLIYDGVNIEQAIAELKIAGASQMISVIVLKDALGISLIDADYFIVNSFTWSENKENIEGFRTKFANVVNNLKDDIRVNRDL